MSDILAALRDHLLADAGVSALVADRVRVGWAGKNDFRSPRGAIQSFITLSLIDDRPVHHMTASSGLSIAPVQVDCWAGSRSSIDGANAVSEAVREALDLRLSAIMGSAGMTVDSVVCNSRRSLDEAPADGSPRGVFRDMWEITATYRQTVPLPV